MVASKGMLQPGAPPEEKTMPTKTIRVKIEVPEGTSHQARQSAEHKAHEAAVLAVWQAGEISIRQAAGELGLTYYDFLDLLAAKSIPVESGAFDEEALDRACLLLGTSRGSYRRYAAGLQPSAAASLAAAKQVGLVEEIDRIVV